MYQSSPGTISTADCTVRVASQGAAFLVHLIKETNCKNRGGSGSKTHHKECKSWLAGWWLLCIFHCNTIDRFLIHNTLCRTRKTNTRNLLGDLSLQQLKGGQRIAAFALPASCIPSIRGLAQRIIRLGERKGEGEKERAEVQYWCRIRNKRERDKRFRSFGLTYTFESRRRMTRQACLLCLSR